MTVSAQGLWSVAVVAVAVTALSSGRAARPYATQADRMDVALFRQIARQQTPVVVAIMTRAHVDPVSAEDAEWFERFFRRPMASTRHIERQIGSGFLISPEGDILTTNHLVEEAETISVRLWGNETATYRARVVGSDPVSDSAVIRLEHPPHDLPVATLGDSALLQAGDWVMAIGNPFRLAHSVTVGVVSAEKRSFEVSEGHWQTLVQMDASINPGNSGGPLLNARGEVVGIAIATLDDGIGAAIGIGFAVPINSVKTVLPQLRAGCVRRGQVGVHLRHAPLTGDDAEALGLTRPIGALITSVDSGSSGDRAGLHASDVIIEVGGLPVVDADDVLDRLSPMSPGSLARITVLRDGVARTITAEVEMLPTAPAAHPDAAEPPDFGLTLDNGAAVPSSPARASAAPGAVVLSVTEDGPADRAGLVKGDVLRKVNRHTVQSAADALRQLARIDVSRPAFLLVSRDGHEMLVEMYQD